MMTQERMAAPACVPVKLAALLGRSVGGQARKGERRDRRVTQKQRGQHQQQQKQGPKRRRALLAPPVVKEARPRRNSPPLLHARGVIKKLLTSKRTAIDRTETGRPALSEHCFFPWNVAFCFVLGGCLASTPIRQQPSSLTFSQDKDRVYLSPSASFGWPETAL